MQAHRGLQVEACDVISNQPLAVDARHDCEGLVLCLCLQSSSTASKDPESIKPLEIKKKVSPKIKIH